jgi:hypothetical protein
MVNHVTKMGHKTGIWALLSVWVLKILLNFKLLGLLNPFVLRTEVIFCMLCWTILMCGTMCDRLESLKAYPQFASCGWENSGSVASLSSR